MKNKGRVSFLFALPATIVYTVLLAIPILMAIGISFTKWNGISAMRFIGFENYTRAFRDSRLGNAVINTLIITVIVSVVEHVLGLSIALLLNKTGFRNNLFRTAYFLPYVLSMVAVGFVWKSILAYNGVFNSVTHSLGIGNLTINYMADRKSALAYICLVEIWKYFGYYMMLYIAGLQTVPAELYEACTVDGGNAWHKLTSVTLPMIAPTMSVSLIMSLISGLRVYDVIKVMTDGGPGYDTESVVYNIVTQGFSNNRMGYACAISVILFIVIATASILIMRLGNKGER